MQTEMNHKILPNIEMPALLGTDPTILSRVKSIHNTLDNSLTDTVWVNPHFIYAQRFKTGPSSCTLKSITLGMMGNIAKKSGGFVVSIYSSTSPVGYPEYPVSLSLTGPDDPSFGLNEYYGEMELDANCTYWVVAKVAKGGGTYGWIAGSESSLGSDTGYTESFVFQPEWIIPDCTTCLNMKVNVIEYTMSSEPGIRMEYGMKMLLVAAG